jgi:PPOX class probable F420-dependent enzyme
MGEEVQTPRRIHQRGAIRMSPAEVDAFLHERHALTMCTMGADGSIHAVAMWYGFLDGALAVETKVKSQKVRNVRRDPRMTWLVAAGERYEELRGVELVGRAELVEDPERLWDVGVSVFGRYVHPYTEERRSTVQAMLRKRVAVLLHVERVVSWDHRKLPGSPALGLPAREPDCPLSGRNS